MLLNHCSFCVWRIKFWRGGVTANNQPTSSSNIITEGRDNQTVTYEHLKDQILGSENYAAIVKLLNSASTDLTEKQTNTLEKLAEIIDWVTTDKKNLSMENPDLALVNDMVFEEQNKKTLEISQILLDARSKTELEKIMIPTEASPDNNLSNELITPRQRKLLDDLRMAISNELDHLENIRKALIPPDNGNPPMPQDSANSLDEFPAEHDYEDFVVREVGKNVNVGLRSSSQDDVLVGQYGVWLNVRGDTPKIGYWLGPQPNNDAYYRKENFVSSLGLVNATAEYEGDAKGYAALNNNINVSGQITAKVNLTAILKGENPNISGVIDNFKFVGLDSDILKDWNAEFDNGQWATDSSLYEVNNFRGAKGLMQVYFYTDATKADAPPNVDPSNRSIDKTNSPSNALGWFDLTFGNGRAVGAFDAERERSEETTSAQQQ